MPKPLSEETRSQIVKLHLAGETRGSIAEKLGVSEGAVWNVIKEFTDEHKKDPKTVEKAFRVDQELAALRELAVRLKKLELSVADARAGAGLLERLRELDVDEEGLSSFVSDLYRSAKGRGHEITEVVDASIRLLELEVGTKMGYRELLKSFDDLSAKRSRLADEVNGLRAEAKSAKEERDEAIEDSGVTDKALKEFCTARDALKEVGADIADFATLGKMIANAKELSLDPQRIVEEIAAVDGLLSRHAELEKSVTALKAKKDAVEVELSQLMDELKGKESVAEKLEGVEGLGLGIDDLETLRRTIVNIGSKYGLEAKGSLARLLKDIREQYDMELGFESQLNRTKARLEIAQLTADKWTAKAESLEDAYRAEKSVVNAMRALMKAGVDRQRILGWNALLEKLGTDILTLGKDLEAYPKVKELIEAKEEEAGTLEKKIEGLDAKVKELEGRRSELVSSISAVSTSGIEEVRRAGVGIVAEVEAVGDRMKEEASKHLEGAKKVVDETKVEIESLYEEALRTGMRLGELKFLEPIHKLISSCEGDPSVVYPTLKHLFLVFEKWLEKNPPKNQLLLSNLKSVSNSLNEEMSLGRTK